MENSKTDLSAIAKALEDFYFRGIYEGDTVRLGGIFNAGTLLFGSTI